ncbi:unnamed protein product [Symbiodinium natans]|uniref:EamA domain-containing protein n=1 Tax=Symbiodinium natans TaxID=878477 RepID=A0A812LXS2_9DINO|nr:unnamed protein product [Symbiodinium natans]
MRRGVARRPLRLIFLASSLGLLFRAFPAWRDDSVAFVESARRGLGLGPGPDGFPTVGPLTGQSSRGVSEPAKGFEATWEEEESEETLWKSVTAFNAACWGATYISTKAGIDHLATLPLLPWVLRSSTAESARTSAIVGSLNGFAYAAIFTAYTLGTTGGKAAFICSLQTIVVAACTSIAAQRLQVGTVVSAVMAVVGVGFLELAGGPMETSAGDLLCSAAPVAIGIGWYMLGDTMKKYPDDTLPSLAIQFVCFTVLFATWILGDIGWKHGAPGIVDWLGQVPAILQTPGLWPPLLFSTFLGNVITMLLANRAVQSIKVSEVSLISASEPLWAALAAMLYLGEVFTLADCIGGGFILTALVCNELWEEGDAEPKGAAMPEVQQGRFPQIRPSDL